MPRQYTRQDPVAAFWSRVDKRGECWLWTGPQDRGGYGRFTVRDSDRTVAHRAHRLAYQLRVGPIPEGYCVCHNCPGGDNRLCVNPAHLWLGTHAQNIADRDAKGRTARGLRNGANTRPERRARGDRSGARLHPDTHVRGETHGCAKLTEDTVREIRRRRDTGETLKALAVAYDVSFGLIWQIAKRRAWRHV